ncbi:fasciclin domain-containing protein [Luteimonas kalidii]|uniref:Fasciclin domain-containing protein n=1 Tax=Luteimonas kalidii TaxID=3042025 RepID=A0ABT6JQA7_9GAMM|nr:fasciclin domain-containing protein [Luteimonas kalidii]MDH5832799.1 fasciclin domain-containing protein [Luteimonas kalidii]
MSKSFHTSPGLRRLVAALALGLSAPLALAAQPAATEAAAPQAQADIVDTAVAAGQFTTLAAALQAAGLVDTLKGAGPFTVFAPTDEAFAALPAGTVENLLKPENKDQLVAILTYHVVPGRYPASTVVTLDEATTVQGGSVDIATAGSGVTVDGANVVTADVAASNGVIHVIDKVLMPDG